MIAREVFLDTAYAIALASTRDHFHALAVTLAEELERTGTTLVTTRAILLEIGNALAKQRYRAAATALLAALEADPQIDIVDLSPSLYLQAWDLYQARPDKEWGLTDCVSFVVMQGRGLTQVLTSDEHFRQAGFITLLNTN